MFQAAGAALAVRRSDALAFFLEFADHLGGHICWSWMPWQGICRRKQETFKRFGARGNGANQLRILRGGQEIVGGPQFFHVPVMRDVKDGLSFTTCEGRPRNLPP